MQSFRRIICTRTYSSKTDAEAFNRIVHNRRAVLGFKPDPIPSEIVQDILESTRRAPTGFNAQPYAGIVLTDAEDRQLLSTAMLGSNAQKVREAPFVIVFAADLEPSKRVPHLQQLEREAGLSEDSIAQLPMRIRMFANQGALAGALKCAISTAFTPVMPVPSYVPTMAWSYKQTVFAASTFLYAAQSHGIDTCPMEGFDISRVKYCLDIPDRYSVPVIIAAGYGTDKSKYPASSPRLPLSELFFKGKFGGKFEP